MTDERTVRTTARGVLSRGAMGAVLALLCACQSTQQARAPETGEELYEDRFQISNIAGLIQTAPDEFSVITKRPLEMPGDFAALPTPEPGKRSTRDPDPLSDARAALSFDPVPAASGRTPVSRSLPVAMQGASSASEQAILSAAGPIDPDIRATLASEQAAYDAEQNVYVLDRLFPRLREMRGEADPDAIDAEAERRRLAEAGIVAGRTPTAVQVVPAQVAPVQVAPVQVIPSPAPVADPVGDAGLIFLP